MLYRTYSWKSALKKNTDMSKRKTVGVELRTLTRSVSVHEEPPSTPDEPPPYTQMSQTATPSLLGRWKRSLRRKINGSPAGSIVGGRGDIEEPTSIDISKLSSFEEPHDYPSDSLDNDIELSVRICRDGIYTNLQDMLRNCGGDIRLLDAIEEGKNSAKDLISSANEEERKIALLWTCFQRRPNLLPDLLNGADLDLRTTEEGLTAIHLAAFSNSPECLHILLAAGARCNVLSKTSLTPLHCAALGNSPDCIRLLLAAGASVNLTHPDKSNPQDAPIHSAVKANAPECVQLLLSYGADPSVIGEGGFSPIHLASDHGYTECLRILLKSGKFVDVNAKTQDRKGHTALHLAAEEENFEDLQLLLAHNADASLRNLRGQTALHVAARVQSVECIRLLLPKSDVNAVDADGRTPLHAAVGRAAGAAEAAEVLVTSAKVDINASDRYGHTALHTAAMNELPTASAVLIKCGADLTARTKRGSTALGLVVKKAPAALYAIEELLDSSIRMSHEIRTDRDVELKLDFKPLLSTDRRVEVSLLSTFIAEGHPELLQHPLCQSFLHLKWMAIRKFYVARLLITFVFMCCLSLYVLTELRHGCEKDEVDIRARTYQLLTEKCGSGDKVLRALYLVPYAQVAILVLAAEEISRKIFGLISALSAPSSVSIRSALKIYILQLDNILEWFTLISVFLISDYIWNIDGDGHTWHRHVGAFAVLSGWANLMILIGQLPLFGAYVAMYTCVLREFMKLLGAYLFLLVGFAISFCVIFPDVKEFDNPIGAMIKVLVMMTGELEYKSLFYPDNQEAPNSDVSKDQDEYLVNVSARIIFVFCLLLVTVALMNLLVGIAVHDIHGLRTSAGLSKLQRQAELVSYVETAIGSGCCSCGTSLWSPLRRPFFSRLKCCSSRNRPRANSTVLHIKPYNTRDRRLPRELVKAAYEIAKGRKQGKLGYSRQASSSAPGVMTFPTAPRKEAPCTLASRRRTTYIKSEGAAQQAALEAELEVMSIVKQVSEEMQELRQMLETNQIMLRKLLATNEPLDSPK